MPICCLGTSGPDPQLPAHHPHTTPLFLPALRLVSEVHKSHRRKGCKSPFYVLFYVYGKTASYIYIIYSYKQYHLGHIWTCWEWPAKISPSQILQIKLGESIMWLPVIRAPVPGMIPHERLFKQSHWPQTLTDVLTTAVGTWMAAAVLDFDYSFIAESYLQLSRSSRSI